MVRLLRYVILLFIAVMDFIVDSGNLLQFAHHAGERAQRNFFATTWDLPFVFPTDSLICSGLKV